MQFDVGVIIPLKEEFRYVAEIAPITTRHAFDGTFFYELDFGLGTTIACIVGEMGPLPASQATNRLLSFADVKLLVLLGIAGAIDAEVMLGDVVIANEVNEFLAKSKAVDAKEGYEFKFSGRHSRMEYSLREAVNHFDVSGGDCLKLWCSAAEAANAALGSDVDKSLCRSTPTFHLGSIASGDVVGAATAFTEELLQIDRKFLALDMEAAGVVKAASDRLRPIPVIVVRGISDFADKRKKLFDGQGQGAWRRFGVQNAANLFLSLLAWTDFRSSIGLVSDVGVEKDDCDPQQIVEALRKRTGGPWLAGILFGLHSQVPVLSDDGDAVPRDIGAVRIADARLDNIIVSLEKIRSALESKRISPSDACDQLGAISDSFQATLTADQVELVKQFDRVMFAIFPPFDDIESSERRERLAEVASLLDDHRLAEAEQILSLLDVRETAVRELLADLYFIRKDHDELVQLLSPCDPETLSRRELEHFITSCYESSRRAMATTLLEMHRTSFSDAAGKLFQGHITARHPTNGSEGGT